jgi:hypothetical protein
LISVTVETMKLPDLPKVTKRSSEPIKDNINSANESTTPDNSEKSHASESDVPGPSSNDVQPADDDIKIIQELSDVKISDSNDSTVVPKVEKSPKKSKKISELPPANEVIVVDSDTEIASDLSDMEIDDDIAGPHQYKIGNDPDKSKSDVSKAKVLPKDFNYIDDDEVYEVPLQLHDRVDEAFLKCTVQGIIIS